LNRLGRHNERALCYGSRSYYTYGPRTPLGEGLVRTIAYFERLLAERSPKEPLVNGRWRLRDTNLLRPLQGKR
jgi:hypothetical protein